MAHTLVLPPSFSFTGAPPETPETDLEALTAHLERFASLAYGKGDDVRQKRVKSFSFLFTLFLACFALSWATALLCLHRYYGSGYFYGVDLLVCGLAFLLALAAIYRFKTVRHVPWLLSAITLQAVVVHWLAHGCQGVSKTSEVGFTIATLGLCGLFLLPSPSRLITGHFVAQQLLIITIHLLEWHGVCNPWFRMSSGEPTRPLLPVELHFLSMAYQMCLDVFALFMACIFRLRASTTENTLMQEKALSERLLHNTLPATVAQNLLARLRAAPQLGMMNLTVAHEHDMATILFADICNFTNLCSQVPAQKLVEVLNRIVQQCDRAAFDLRVEKIKTIGDAYMAAAIPNSPDTQTNSAACVAVLNFSIMLHQLIPNHAIADQQLSFRIGVHSGPIVSGVIGLTRFSYDIWGDTVNLASRLESTGVPGETQASSQTMELASDVFQFTYRGKVKMKGKGDVDTYLLRATQPKVRTPLLPRPSNGNDDVSWVPWLQNPRLGGVRRRSFASLLRRFSLSHELEDLLTEEVPAGPQLPGAAVASSSLQPPRIHCEPPTPGPLLHTTDDRAAHE